MKKAFIQLHLSVLLAGFTGVFGKLISLNEGLITWYRLFISAIVFFLILALSGRLIRLTKRECIVLGSSGVLLALHWLFFYGSIKYSNISIGVVCFSLTSFITAILEPLVTGKKFSLSDIGLSTLTVIGILLIFHFDSSYRTGITLGIISSAVISYFTIVNKRLTGLYDTGTMLLYQMTGGCLAITLLLPLYLHFSPASTLLPSPGDAGFLLFLAIVCTVVMYYMITQALRKIPSFTVNLSFNLEPVYSIILAMIIYQENKQLSAAFYTGLGLILLSVVLQMANVLRLHRQALRTLGKRPVHSQPDPCS
jgi:drug/metabolite transporter (DMT)-like permease